MNISEPFIRRPVATTLMMVGLLLAGIVSFLRLPVSALPEVDYPTIVVSTMLPGASADTMATSVTTPLERQFGQMPSVEQMSSTSSFGSSQITIRFTLDRNIDAAEQDVQAAINAAATLLPRTLPTPPTYSKSNPADTPILTLAVTSSTLPLSKVHDVVDSILAQKIAQVSGVGLVSLAGSQKPAVRVRVDPEALAGAGLTLEDVRQSIVAASVNLPKGSLDGARQNFTIATNDQLTEASAFKSIVIGTRDNASIRLQDIADVESGVENAELAAWVGRDRAIVVNVQRQPGANVIEVADRVKALLPQLQASLPQGVKITVTSDRTETVRAAIGDVEFTLAITIVLVVGVIFVFLRSLRATFIPGIAVPLSLIGTFGVMDLAGYSLNNLSLMALTIATGFVVDDAIVMIENIARIIEQQKEGEKSAFLAALEGSKQIGFTIVSLTVSLVAVLIPLLFMGGLVGRLFREFAVTLAVSIVVSALLSLTLTAMMCAHVLRAEPPPASRGRMYRALEGGFEWMQGVYLRGLEWVLAHRTTTLLATLGTVALTGVLTVAIPKGFFPREDTGLVMAITEAPPDVSFARMTRLQEAVADVVLKDPDVAQLTSFIGADGSNPALSSGRLAITLKPRADRKDSLDRTLDRLREALANVEGVTVYLQAVQDLQIETRVSRTPYQYTLEDADSAELAMWARNLQEKLAASPSLRDVSSDDRGAGRQTNVVVDRDTASRLGLSAQNVDDTLYDAFGQRQVATIFTQLNLYRVILEVKREYGSDPSALARVYVRPNGGTNPPVPLSAFAHFAPGAAPLAIGHEGPFPAITLSFDLAPGVSLGEAVDVIHDAERAIGMPSTVRAQFQGSASAFQESLASEGILVLAAIIAVYIVLGVLYESTIHPVTILSTLPSAGVGALVALIVTGGEFTVIALIGVVLLIGIVKKNAIMMIDFALDAEREEHKTPVDAIREACRLRFRPIMMTTAAALLGGVPLALGTGTGSELRRPLGIAIVGGLIVSQVLTLYTTPVIYLAMGRVKQWLVPRSNTPAVETAP